MRNQERCTHTQSDDGEGEAERSAARHSPASTHLGGEFESNDRGVLIVDRLLNKWVIGFVVIAVVIAGLFLIGGDEFETIDEPADELMLTEEQAPDGWSLDDSEGDDTEATATFVSDDRTVDVTIIRYETTQEAEQAYSDRLRSDQTSYTTESSGIGDEGHHYAEPIEHEYHSVFRQTNIVVEVKYDVDRLDSDEAEEITEDFAQRIQDNLV